MKTLAPPQGRSPGAAAAAAPCSCGRRHSPASPAAAPATHEERAGTPARRGAGEAIQQRALRARLGHRFDHLPVKSDPTRPRHAGRALPTAVRAKMEQALGGDFSGVRIHEGPQAEAVGALAFTRGSALHFGPGTYDPSSRPGQRLLAHELAHVVQQRAGRVTVPRGASVPINDDPRLEAEAERLGERAAAHRSAPAAEPASPNPLAAAPVQQKRRAPAAAAAAGRPPAPLQRKPDAAATDSGQAEAIAAKAEARCNAASRAKCKAVGDRQRKARQAGSTSAGNTAGPGADGADGDDEEAAAAAKGSTRNKVLGGLGILGGAAGIAAGALTLNPVLLGLGAMGVAKGAAALWRGYKGGKKPQGGAGPADTATPAAAAAAAPAASATPAAAANGPQEIEMTDLAPRAAPAATEEAPTPAAAPLEPEAAAPPAEEHDTGAADLQADVATRSTGRFPSSSQRRGLARAGRRESRTRRRTERTRARSRRHFQQSRDRLERRSRSTRTHAKIAAARRPAPGPPPTAAD